MGVVVSKWKYCEDVKEVIGEFDCCSSCHEDAEEGYDGMVEEYGKNYDFDSDSLLSVCCRCRQLTNEEFKKVFETPQPEEEEK